LAKGKKKPRPFAEIIAEQHARVTRMVTYASQLDDPILYMQLLMASNSLRVAALVAKRLDAGNGPRAATGIDIQALVRQYFDFLNNLPKEA